MPTTPDRPTTPLREIVRWQDLLGLELPQETLAAEQQRLEAWHRRLRQLARPLVRDARRAFPSAPVYLATAPDRSNTLLRWRRRHAPGRGGRVEIDDPAVTAWLAVESVPQCRRFLTVDQCRCILNHHHAAVVYALQRMQQQNDLRRRRLEVLHQMRATPEHE